jgi:hypothetical protein
VAGFLGAGSKPATTTGGGSLVEQVPAPSQPHPQSTTALLLAVSATVGRNAVVFIEFLKYITSLSIYSFGLLNRMDLIISSPKFLK